MKRKNKLKNKDVKIITTELPLVDSIDDDCDCHCDECTCHSIKEYNPKEYSPIEYIDKGIDTYEITEIIRNFENDALKCNDKIRSNGWKIDYDRNNGLAKLKAVGDTRYAAFIPASPIGSNNDKTNASGATMINTIDHGPCFVAPTENGVEAITPVYTATFIGTAEQPYGLYIPFNAAAMKDGLLMTARCLDTIIKHDENISRLDCMLGACGIDENNSTDNDYDSSYDNTDDEELEW